MPASIGAVDNRACICFPFCVLLATIERIANGLVVLATGINTGISNVLWGCRLSTSDMSVSVVVPCYNAEKFLDQCLSSIEADPMKELEIIVLNDGSTDGSLAIMEAHAAGGRSRSGD